MNIRKYQPPKPDQAPDAALPAHSPVITRRKLLLLAGGLFSGIAFAKNGLPDIIRMMVSAPPGGSLDFGARIVSPPLAQALGDNVVVMNKGGASGTINAADVVKSTPDGSSLLYATATATIVAPQTMSPPPFHPLKDLIAINLVGASPVVVALNPRLGIKNLKGLVALSRTRPVTLGSSGTGSLMHLMIESVAQAMGANFVHVPYRGVGPSIMDTVAGQIDGCFSDFAPVIPFLQNKRVVLVAVSTKNRLEAYPDVPTLSEDIPGFIVANWQGIFAPARTPKATIDKINAGLLKVAARKDVQSKFKNGGILVDPKNTPEEFQKLVADDYHRWGKLLKERGIV